MIHKTSPPSYVEYWARSNSITLTNQQNGPPCSSTAYPAYSQAKGVWTVPGDEIWYENSGGRKFNYCKHIKDRVQLFDTDAPIAIGSESVYKIVHGLDLGPGRPSAPALSLVTDDMRRRAWNALQPTFGSGFQLLNFLYELKDMPQLWRSLASFYSLATKPEVLGRILKDGKTKTASELILTYSFAIAPLMRDIEAVFNATKSIRQALHDFEQKGKRAQSFHYRETIAEGEIAHTNTWYGYATTRTRPEFFATLRCTYDYKKPSFLQAAARYWGFRPTPEVLWNMLPFSFVLDWVYKVGDSLGSLDTDPNLRIHLTDYCETVKTSIWVSRFRSSNGNTMDAMFCASDGIEMMRWTRSIYERQPTSPTTGFAFPMVDSLNLRELVLAGALGRSLL